jgi:hypothetical protein
MAPRYCFLLLALLRMIYVEQQEGAGITNGWRACDHVDSVQDALLDKFWRF